MNELFPSMTKGEARLLVKRIQDHINDARALVLELYERMGWEALGYGSWRECVVAEFDQSKSHLYRLLDAAKVERNISPMGENSEPIAERVLRPLAKLEPEQQRQAWELATASNPNPTAAQVEQIAKTIAQAVADAHRDFAAKNPIIKPSPDDPPLSEAEMKLGPDWCENWLTISGAIGKILTMPDFDAAKAAEFAVYQNGDSADAQKAVLILESYIAEIEKLCIQKI